MKKNSSNNYIFVLFIIIFLTTSMFALEKTQNLAVVVDKSGVKTELISLMSNVQYFTGYKVGGKGIVINIKDFLIPNCSFGGYYHIFVPFNQIREVVLIKGNRFKIELLNNKFVEGEIDDVINGNCTLGSLSLSFYEIKSLRIINYEEITIVPQSGKDGQIELRNGFKINSANITRYYCVPSKYLNVLDDYYCDTYLWMEVEHGQGKLKIKKPFDEIKIISFDKVTADKYGYSAGESVTVTLKDGSVLHGQVCDRFNYEERFNTICGISDSFIFEVNGQGLGWAIKSIIFN